MFCPDCGAAEQSPNAYCKRCGQWLSDQKFLKSKRANTPEKRMKTMVVFNALSAVFSLASAIALYTSIGTPGAKAAMLVAGAFCSVIAVHQTISFFLTLQLMQRFKRGRGDTKQLDKSDDKPSIVSLNSGKTAEFINGRSVTENSTELLEVTPGLKGPGDTR
jgi:hypothetical protein